MVYSVKSLGVVYKTEIQVFFDINIFLGYSVKAEYSFSYAAIFAKPKLFLTYFHINLLLGSGLG